MINSISDYTKPAQKKMCAYLSTHQKYFLDCNCFIPLYKALLAFSYPFKNPLLYSLYSSLLSHSSSDR